MVARKRKNPSPRYLAFRHARTLLRSRGLLAVDDDHLEAGHQRLHSYMTPGLYGGGYTINTTQEIDGADKLADTQPFFVDKFLFKLPEGEIHSVYPPQGHKEWAEALPHIVFNTPSTPWEWAASNLDEEPDYKANRNRVPWLAVFVFTKDELELSREDLVESNGIFGNIKGKEDIRQTKGLSVPVRVKDIEKLQKTVSPVKPTPTTTEDTTTELIFLRRELFTTLFCEQDQDGNLKKDRGPDVRPYRFLAHRRDINSTGMAVAAKTATEDDQQSYSVILSHRTGPTSATEPTNCIAHLVSIYNVQHMNWSDTSEFVAMSSLYSWSYSCYPSTTPNVYNQFVKLGESSQMLHAAVDAKDLPGFDIPPKVKGRVLTRLHNGYTMARYRVKTGESTACFTRGAFIPVPNIVTEYTWDRLSNSGSDLQVLDKQLGIMDITYSAAWQLGRTMAIADQSFVTSLGLVRKNIYDLGMYYYQLELLSERSREQIIAAVPSLVQSLQSLQHSRQLSVTNSESRFRRWFRPPVKPVDRSYAGRSRINIYGEEEDPINAHFHRAAREISSACDKESPDAPSKDPYNEYNTPFSADWMTVLKWVLDRLVFSNIPTHYLVTDGSHLPEESVRFFEVDTRWMNAMVDGALSLANYIDQEDDKVRKAIFHAIHLYRTTPIPELDGERPPLPVYGCYVRSALITKFPDLKVEIRRGGRPIEHEELILLRHDIVNVDTMFCLFSKRPSTSTWDELWLTQPPHQQSFVAGATVDANRIKIPFRKAYTTNLWKEDGDDVNEPMKTFFWDQTEQSDGSGASGDPNDPEKGPGVIYHWTDPDEPSVEVRRLSMEYYAQLYLKTAQNEMDQTRFDDEFATSALMATQMNSFAWRLKIGLKGASSLATQVERVNPFAEEAESSVPLTLPAPSDPIDNRPYFVYKVRSMDNPGSRSIYMTKIPQDLIFHIVMQSGWGSLDTHLEYLRFTLPLKDPNAEGGAALMKSYIGPGAYMLSNVRFNPLLSFRKTDEGVNTHLVITLTPRKVATNGRAPGVWVKNCRELSFVLTGVYINRYPTDNRRVSYNGKEGNGKVEVKYNDRTSPEVPEIQEETRLRLEKKEAKSMKDTRAAFLESAVLP